MTTKKTLLSGEELYEIAVKTQQKKAEKREASVNEILNKLQKLVYYAIVRAAKRGFTEGTETVYYRHYENIFDDINHQNETKLLIENLLIEYNKRNFNISIKILQMLVKYPTKKPDDLTHTQRPTWILECTFNFFLPKGKGASAPLNPSRPSGP